MKSRRRDDLTDRSYWLVVERLENWERDRHSGFTCHGFARRKEGILRRLKQDDWLIVYVSSGISAFSDVRRVKSANPQEAIATDAYSREYPLTIQTEPIVTLPRDKWVKAVSIIDRISAIKTPWNWMVMFRSTLHRLGKSDALGIVRAIRTADDSKPRSRVRSEVSNP